MIFEFAKGGHVFKVDAWGFTSRSEREGGNEEPVRLRPKERLVLSVLVRSAEPVTEDILWRRVWQGLDEEMVKSVPHELIRKQVEGLRKALGSHEVIKVDRRTYTIDAEVRRIHQYHPPFDPHRHENRANAISAKLLDAISAKLFEATGQADHAGEAEVPAVLRALRMAGALRDEIEQERHPPELRPPAEPASLLVTLPASLIHGNGSEPVEIGLHEIAAIRADGKVKVLGYSSAGGPLSIEAMDVFVPRDHTSLDAFVEWADIDPYHGIGLSSDGGRDAMLVRDHSGVPKLIVVKVPGAIRLTLAPSGGGYPTSLQRGRDKHAGGGPIPGQRGRDEHERSLPWQFSYKEYEYRASFDGSLVVRFAGDAEAEEIRLPRILGKLLILLLKSAGRRLFVLRGPEILSEIWPGRDCDDDSSKALVREHVGRLNRKLCEGTSRDRKPIVAGYQLGSYVLQSQVTYVADPLDQTSLSNSLRYPVTMMIPPVCHVVRGPDGLRERFELNEVKAIRSDGQPFVLGYAHDFEIESIMLLFSRVEIGSEGLLAWAGVVHPSRTKLVKDAEEGVWFCAEEQGAGRRDEPRMMLVSSLNATLEWDREDIPIPFLGLCRLYAAPTREPE